MQADEELCLKRLFVASKRRDWRMYAHGLTKLEEELSKGKFFHPSRWGQVHEEAQRAEGFPKELLAELERLILPILSQPASEKSAAIACVAAWSGAFQAAQAEIERNDKNLPTGSLSELLDRAGGLSACGHPPEWGDRLYSSLLKSLKPTPTIRLDRGACLLTDDPGLSWERRASAQGLKTDRLGEGQGFEILKLCGSIDWFYCPECKSLSTGQKGILTLACDRCLAPSRPLVVPMHPHFFPPPMRSVWDRASRVLSSAQAFVLLEPSPEEDFFSEFLRTHVGDRPVLVASCRPNVIQAWSRRGKNFLPSPGPSEGIADRVATFAKEKLWKK